MNRGFVTEVSVTPLTAEQRQRLEAFTFARAILGPHNTVRDLLRVARYVSNGRTDEP